MVYARSHLTSLLTLVLFGQAYPRYRFRSLWAEFWLAQMIQRSFIKRVDAVEYLATIE